jgi:hypothetical protein
VSSFKNLNVRNATVQSKFNLDNWFMKQKYFLFGCMHCTEIEAGEMQQIPLPGFPPMKHGEERKPEHLLVTSILIGRPNLKACLVPRK